MCFIFLQHVTDAIAIICQFRKTGQCFLGIIEIKTYGFFQFPENINRALRQSEQFVLGQVQAQVGQCRINYNNSGNKQTCCEQQSGS